MPVYKIELLEPKAKQLLDELQKLNLIKVTAMLDPQNDKELALQLLEKLQAPSDFTPTEEEITAEVEAVRAARYKSN